MKKIFLGLILLFFTVNGFCQYVFFGPMLHYNFGKEKNNISFALEVSVWTEFLNLPASLDLGVEVEKTKTRIYSEVQYSIVPLTGISFGIVKEFPNKECPKTGIQASLWCAYFGGLDVRYRKIGENKYIAPGLFFKFPVAGRFDID